MKTSRPAYALAMERDFQAWETDGWGWTPRTSAAPARRRRLLPRGAKDGFTLIEVLLAVAIFAIVLLAIHMVFYAALQLRNKTTEAIAKDLPLQQALAILKRDLANIVMPGGTLFGELQTMATSNTSNSLAFLAPSENSIPGQSSPAFFTASGLLQEDAPWGKVERVSYFLTPSTNNTPGKDLIRSAIRNLLPTFEEEPEEQPLLTGLQSIFFSFYDGLQWRDYWDSTVESNKLPQGIKVELQMVGNASDRSSKPPITLVVPLILQAGTNETTQAESGASGEEDQP